MLIRVVLLTGMNSSQSPRPHSRSTPNGSSTSASGVRSKQRPPKERATNSENPIEIDDDDDVVAGSECLFASPSNRRAPAVTTPGRDHHRSPAAGAAGYRQARPHTQQQHQQAGVSINRVRNLRPPMPSQGFAPQQSMMPQILGTVQPQNTAPGGRQMTSTPMPGRGRPPLAFDQASQAYCSTSCARYTCRQTGVCVWQDIISQLLAEAVYTFSCVRSI